MKKIIHALLIIDKSTSMASYRSRTVEGINANMSALKAEVDENTEILVTQLQFSKTSNHSWGLAPAPESGTDFVFTQVGKNVTELVDLTEKEYNPGGWTPLLDAIGYGIEKVKAFHGDKLGDENLKIIVTIFTDGEENSSTKWGRDEIKKMIQHFQADNKWTFTFIGCGDIDSVTATSATYGVLASNTVAIADNDAGRLGATTKISTSYTNYARATKSGVVDNTLFTAKSG